MLRGIYSNLIAIGAAVFLTVSCDAPEAKTSSKKDDESSVATEDLNKDGVIDENDIIENIVPVVWENVEMAFLTPDEDEYELGQIDVEVEFENISSSVVWSLYYNQSASSTEGAVAIAERMPTTKTKVTWDSTNQEALTYFLFVVLENGASRNIRFMGSPISLIESGSGNRSPFLTITDNNGGARVYRAGDSLNLSFESADPNPDDSLQYDVDYTGDGGETWTKIYSGLTKDSAEVTYDEDSGEMTLSAEIPSNADFSGRANFRVTALDPYGLFGNAQISNNFGVSPSDISYVNDVRPIFVAKCTPCHDTGNTPSRGLILTYFDAVMTNTRSRNGFNNRRNQTLDRIQLDETNPNVMPPQGNDRLTQTELDTIYAWFMRQKDANQSRLVGSARPGGATNSLTAPANNSTHTIGDTINITWDITDNDDALTYNVYYSTDNTNYTKIADQISASSFGWDTTGRSADTYRIRVAAYDNDYRVNNYNVTSVDITLQP